MTDDSKWMTPCLREAWALSAVIISMVGQGAALAFSSILVPMLTSGKGEIHADLDSASMVASVYGLAGMPAIFLAAYTMGRYGRRIASIVFILPGVGWLVIYFATTTTHLIIGRMLCGISAAGGTVTGAIIIGEYSSPKNRGMCLNLKTSGVSLGSMITHILSNFLHWRTIALIAMIPYVAAGLIMVTWPESPAWLAANGRFDMSEKAFFWLRGKDEHSKREFTEMIRVQKERLKRKKKTSWVDSTKNFCKVFTKKDFLKPTFVIMLGVMLLEASGRHIFPAFALDIISQITGSKTETFYVTLCLDLLITASVTFSSILVKIMKRRLLLFSTGFASLVVLAVACSYLLLVARDVISKDYPLIPVALFIIFFILVNLGCTPMPLIFMGELLPLPYRAIGSALNGVLIIFGIYLSLQLVPYLLFHCKVHGTFTILGVIMTVLLVFLYFLLPETKDRTLQEIEGFFVNGEIEDDVENVEDTDAQVKMLPRGSLRDNEL